MTRVAAMAAARFRHEKRGAKLSHVARPTPVWIAPLQSDRPPEWRDPGRRCDPAKIDALIEQVFNDGPRLATRIST